MSDLNEQNILANAAELVAPWAQSKETPEKYRVDFEVSARDLPLAARALQSGRWGYLSAITGLDLGPEIGKMEALYQFCNGPAIVTLRVATEREAPTVPSICESYPSASLYERELIEMLGFIVENTPNPDRLFLPEDWPDGVYPLRKDFDQKQLEEASPRRVPEQEHQQVEKFTIPIGPQHPALKEPGHFEFTVEGEVVTEASVRLGYAHRGIEKAAESRSWIQNLYLMERICGICSHIHTFAYCLGVEQLAGVDAPPRAQAIRELVAGLERIHSHFLWFGVAAHQAGFDTLFMYAWRDRETIMDVLESLSGNRVNYSANVLGGVKFDINDQQAALLREGLDYLEQRTRHYLDVVRNDATFLRRTHGIGRMTKEQAERWGVIGPTARASGVARDIRVEAPYASYKEFPIKMVTEEAGDLEARFIVRLRELLESYITLRDILDRLPGGDLEARMPRKIPAGETVARVEAPRGELFYFLKSDGGDSPVRLKVRTPTLCNMASVVTLAVGHQLADVPMLLSGVDPCFSCNDRVATIRQDGGEYRAWSWEELRRYGIEKYRDLL